ncbi:hypothetical protein [Eubacterium sp.]|uniref:hypothetical protein n=1 Tax=Eubacterium sp. TaxID=142586 RepID=UPI0026DFBEAD|nr:hypothetical protein [Eubacterium sp.]MDO5433341.1 hypothetical protein [Eubacterium sp.]
MQGRIGGTVATRTKGIMQLSGDNSPPVFAPVKIEYRIGADEWSIWLFDVRITLKRTPRQQVSCRIGKEQQSCYPCEIKDNKEKGTWSIKINGIGLWIKVRRQDILSTIGKEAMG